ncbi:hypothetical protein HPB50_005897 [Hyalomma asiaticum]|uniref:Uncharacterized protein n=1 Tax=Hyalomma asiaticum TaxID=266040 RepID=A0ACB7T4S8_HYAAI|nr:hypothetical protein HPB50_005897 [Hyalomma asiaticum]
MPDLRSSWEIVFPLSGHRCTIAAAAFEEGRKDIGKCLGTLGFARGISPCRPATARRGIACQKRFNPHHLLDSVRRFRLCVSYIHMRCTVLAKTLHFALVACILRSLHPQWRIRTRACIARLPLSEPGRPLFSRLHLSREGNEVVASCPSSPTTADLPNVCGKEFAELDVVIYTDWANHYLERSRYKRYIQDLQSDITDGVLLADVIDAVAGVKVPDINRKPKTNDQMARFHHVLVHQRYSDATTDVTEI